MNQNNTCLPKGNPAALKKAYRILFANVPADGHFNPLTGLAKHLQKQGHDVRWYSANLYADKIKKLKIEHYPFVKALDVNGDNIETIFPERHKYKGQVAKLNFDLINFFILRSTEYFEDIRKIHESFPFDVMICDVAFSAIPFVKEKLHIPVVSVGVFPLPETSKDLPPMGLGMMPSSSAAGKVKQNVLRFIADKILFSKSNKVLRNVLQENNINPGNSNVFDLLVKKSSMVLQSGTPGFEYKRSDLGNNIRFIGPLLPYNKTAKEPWLDERLNRYEKVILVTQGTVERDVEKIIVPTLEAFKDSKKHLVIATTGGSKTLELKVRYPHANIIIEDFISFADVMPYADTYITNGGYGGVMLGIQNQLPLVVAGVHEGKNEINARIGYFKLGINLCTEKPMPSQMKMAVDKVLSDDTYRKNIASLAKEFEQYDSCELCETYIDELITKEYLNSLVPLGKETIRVSL